MRAVPTSWFLSFRIFSLGFASCLGAIPAGGAAPLESTALSTLTWGNRGERDPLLVVWIPSGGIPNVELGSARLTLDERILPETGRVLDLGPPGLEAVVWTVPPEHWVKRVEPGAHRIGVSFDGETSGGSGAGMSAQGELGFSGAPPAVLCLECTPQAREAIDRLLLEGAGTRDLLHPAQPGILEVSGARIYPNPMSPLREDATLVFTLSEAAEVEVTAYDWNGDYVDTVFLGSLVAGAQSVPWGGQTEDGRKLGNGVYLVRIVAKTDVRQESQVVKAVVWNEN